MQHHRSHRLSGLLALVVLAALPFCCPLSSPAAAAKQGDEKGQAISMATYSLKAHFGQDWQFDSDERKESIRFQRVIKPAPGSQDVTASSSVQVFKKKTPRDQRSLDENKVADLYRDNEEKRVKEDLVAKESFLFAGAERGTKTVGGRKVHFLKYSAVKPEVTVDALIYLYFPKDYKDRQAFYVFFMSEAYKKDKYSPDLTRIDPLVASFKAVKPKTPVPPVPEDLLEAVDSGDIAETAELLDRGVDPNSKNKDGWSAVSVAAAKGNLKMLRLLVERGGRVNEATSHGQTPLIFAAHWGHAEAVSFLLDSGADINAQMADGWTALIDAIHMDKKQAAHILITRGADVNLKTRDGWTALITAAYQNNVETARLLVERGADVNAKDFKNNSALSLAKSRGYQDMVTLLSNAGARE